MERKKRIPNPILVEGKVRLANIKEKFAGSYLKVTLQHYPSYNNANGIFIIQNVWQGKSHNEELIQFWEVLAGIREHVDDNTNN